MRYLLWDQTKLNIYLFDASCLTCCELIYKKKQSDAIITKFYFEFYYLTLLGFLLAVKSELVLFKIQYFPKCINIYLN